MFGDGSSTRSFCYIDDLLSGIIKVYETESAIGQVINLGNPVEFTIADAIKEFESITGKELNKEYMAAPPDDPKKRKPDITKAKNLLNWEPTIDFKTGMAKTLKYYETK
jgi:nucleoside-diphosphate-sugar epimerase